MAENFYSILTRIGLAKLANAQFSGKKVNLTEIAVGDGGGSYYNPTQDDTQLKNEVWRGTIGSVEIDQENPNWIVIESYIPSTSGGFTVREVGIFDADGDMIAIGKYPETYKPSLDNGASKDLLLRMIIEVTNASAVTLKVDPTVIIASRKYVDDKFSELSANNIRIELSAIPPENPNNKTFWLEDLGESIDFVVGGSGLIIANASLDGSTEIWFKENE